MLLDLTSSCNDFVLQNCCPCIKYRVQMLRRSQEVLIKSLLPQDCVTFICQQRSKCLFEIRTESGEEKKPEPAEQVGRCTHRSLRLPASKGRAENCLSAPSENTNLMDQPLSAFSFSLRRQRLDNKALLLVNKVH